MSLAVQWLALRTLGRRVRPAGQLSSGEPVFEVESVRLALPVGTHHFRPVVDCVRCGTNVVHPSAVLRPAQLRAARRDVLCSACSVPG